MMKANEATVLDPTKVYGHMVNTVAVCWKSPGNTCGRDYSAARSKGRSSLQAHVDARVAHVLA